MKRIALVIAFVLLATVISVGVAYAGGSNLPPTETSPKEGVFYLARTIGEQYPGLTPRYLKRFGNRLFFPVGGDKSPYEINGIDGDTVVHVTLPRCAFVVIRDAKYAKGTLVKLTLDETGKAVSATVFTNKCSWELFAPTPCLQGY